ASPADFESIKSQQGRCQRFYTVWADQYLQQPGLTLLEVAYLLGFADPSNFFRAFRRWFGCTPNEYRARRQERLG
ncbi:AraC family transcriptional regulator, partial [Pseudomonas aeruginosa]